MAFPCPFKCRLGQSETGCACVQQANSPACCPFGAEGELVELGERFYARGAELLISKADSPGWQTAGDLAPGGDSPAK